MLALVTFERFTTHLLDNRGQDHITKLAVLEFGLVAGVIGVCLIAFIINAVTAWLVKRDSEHDLNMRSAFSMGSRSRISDWGAA